MHRTFVTPSLIAVAALLALVHPATAVLPAAPELPERFGTYDLADVDLASWNAAAQEMGVVTFSARGESWTLQLAPNPVRAPDARSVVRLADGTYQDIPLPPSNVFAAHAIDGSGARAVLQITPTEARGRVTTADDRLIYFQPVAEHDARALRGRVFVYEPHDLAVPPGADLSLTIDDLDHVAVPPAPEEEAPIRLANTYTDKGGAVAELDFMDRWPDYTNRIDYVVSLAQDAYSVASIQLQVGLYGQDVGCINTGGDAGATWSSFKSCWPNIRSWGFHEGWFFHYDDMSGCAVGYGDEYYTVTQTKPDACHMYTTPISDHEDAVIMGHESGHIHWATHDAAYYFGRDYVTLMGNSMWNNHIMRFSDQDASHNNLGTVIWHAQTFGF